MSESTYLDTLSQPTICFLTGASFVSIEYTTMDSSAGGVSSVASGTSVLTGPRNGTSSTTLSSPHDEIAIDRAANIPQVDMEKSPTPLQKREKNVWIVVRAFTPA